MMRVFSDDRLSRRAAGGDEHAFAAIFDRYHQRLYRYCLAIVGDSQDAQDALQNTMVKVLRALPGEERKLELKPWLYRIAHNESIELLRRRRETRPLDMELASPGAGLAEEAITRDRLRRLISDLDQLPERQRGALIMRELAGLDFAEIAAALGTSPAVARQTLYEARLGLRKMDEGRAMSCATVTKAISDGDGRVARRRDVRAHLRTCPSCRRFREEIGGRERDLAALAPLPAVAASGLLHSLLGGHSGGGSLAGALGGGAAKTLGTSAALKGAATVAVVAAIGVGAADRGGLVDIGLSGGGPQASQSEQAEQAGAASPASVGSGQAAGASAAGDAGESATGSKASAGHAAKPGQTSDTAGSQNQSAGSSPLSHPHGKGHEKQHPSASTHGQQTAAAHKAGAHGNAPKAHPVHPAKPPHPSSPNPEKGTSPPPPPEKPASEAEPQGNANKPAAGGEEASPE
jgi:RNA polymerase sigma factor (sigma-70 family)